MLSPHNLGCDVLPVYWFDAGFKLDSMYIYRIIKNSYGAERYELLGFDFDQAYTYTMFLEDIDIYG